MDLLSAYLKEILDLCPYISLVLIGKNTKDNDKNRGTKKDTIYVPNWILLDSFQLIFKTPVSKLVHKRIPVTVVIKPLLVIF